MRHPVSTAIHLIGIQSQGMVVQAAMDKLEELTDEFIQVAGGKGREELHGYQDHP